jgi:hypothetical protein
MFKSVRRRHAVDARERFLSSQTDALFTRAIDDQERRKVRHCELAAVAEPQRSGVARAIAHYSDFRRKALAGFELTQSQHNDGHLQRKAGHSDGQPLIAHEQLAGQPP